MTHVDAPRHRFHADLAEMEARTRDLGRAVRAALEVAVWGLVKNEARLCDLVVEDDDAIDAASRDIDRRTVDLLALQAPVAGDLRLAAALLHVNAHLERMADMAVNVAKLARATAALPRDEAVVAELERMGGQVLGVVDTALDAFARRDVALAGTLPSRDDVVDEAHRRMFHHTLRAAELAATAPDGFNRVEWHLRMNQVSRHLERAADHAVDIAAEVPYLVTGERLPFLDEAAASHLE